MKASLLTLHSIHNNLYEVRNTGMVGGDIESLASFVRQYSSYRQVGINYIVYVQICLLRLAVTPDNRLFAFHNSLDSAGDNMVGMRVMWAVAVGVPYDGYGQTVVVSICLCSVVSADLGRTVRVQLVHPLVLPDGLLRLVTVDVVG